MSGQAVTVLGLGLFAIAVTASAQVKTRQVDFTVTYATTGSGASTAHILKASCSMLEGQPGFAGLDGAPTSVTAPGSAMGTMQDEMKKCGSDAACVQALMMKMMQNGTMAKAAAPLNEKNYTLWTPTTCTGTLTVHDRSTKKGMDAMAAYVENVTVKGTADVRPWQGVTIQHDLKKGITEYRFESPEAVMIDRTLVRTGDGAASEKTRERVAAFQAKVSHSLPGAPKSGKAATSIQGGSVTVEWTVVK